MDYELAPLYKFLVANCEELVQPTADPVLKGGDSVRGKLSAGRTAFIWPFSDILRPFLKFLASQLSVDAFKSQIGLKLAELWAKT